MSSPRLRNLFVLVILAVILALSSLSLAGRDTATVGESTLGRMPAFPGAASGQTSGPQSTSAGSQAAAQESKATVVKEVAHDVSPALRDLRPEPPSVGRGEDEALENALRRSRQFALKPQPDESFEGIQRFAGPPAMPGPSLTFEGTGNVNSVLPPDSNGDVGPNHYVEWINLSLQVFSKTGTSLLGPINGNQIFQGLSGYCSSTNQGDPQVLYDSMADRWMISQFAFPGGVYAPTHQCIAVSTSPDPTGTWYRYDFLISNTRLADYPKFGVWPDGYYMSANLFTTPDFNWAGTGEYVFNRAAMLAGQAATMQFFTQGPSEWEAPLPSDLDGLTPPPAGSPNYFVEMTDDLYGPGYHDELLFYKFHVDWANPANSYFSGPTHLPVQPFTSLACGDTQSGNCIPQPGTSRRLQSNFDRLMWRFAYRNYGDHESLVVNHSVATDGTNQGHTGVRWYELRYPQGVPVIYQQGTYAPDSANISRWMGSAAMDHNGNLVVGYSLSGATTYPAIAYAGRLAGDPLGQLTQGEAVMYPGGGSQDHYSGRWGDYTMLSVDPVDDCTFWYINQYYPSTSIGSWHTRIGKFKFASCSIATPTPSRTPTQTVTRVPTRTRTSTPVGGTHTPTVTATPCAMTFTDVHSTDYFYTAVRYLYCAHYISGYGDNTFRPYNNTTRSQLTKIVVNAEGWPIQTPTGTPTFRDVPASDPFFSFVETAYAHSIISGYSCGTGCLEFRGGANITRGQLCKVIVVAENWPIDLSGAPNFRDVEPINPFYGYIETAFNYGVVSGYACGTNCLEFRWGANATRGQIAKIVYNAITQP